MPVSYNQTLSTDMIIAESESLFAWHAAILRACCFPDPAAAPAAATLESRILAWCGQQVAAGAMDRRLYDRLVQDYDRLMSAAKTVLAQSGAGGLSVDAYHALEQAFLSYITQVQRLQHEYGPAAASMDMGLRNSAELKNDIKREQDRFDRKGTSFSVAAISIDGLDDIHDKYDAVEQDTIFSHVGKLIGQAVRSFDDAYYTGNGSYMLVLKHVEFLDACSVTDRLRGEVEKTSIQLPSGDRVTVTASFGIAEAMQKESSEDTITYARDALQQALSKGGNCVEEYQELSSLARFVKNKDS